MQGGTVALATEKRSGNHPAATATDFGTPIASAVAARSARIAGHRAPLAVKAVVDRTAALVGLTLLLPLFVLVALAIRLTSRGPVLFHQVRVGHRGAPFTMLKFRTMRPGAEHELVELLDRNESDGGVLFKMREDPRVTGVGRWLRRLSLDELPQLINVARGSMSLVGPRPPLPGEAARYSADARRRLLVKPGLTGLWQVSGRSNLTWEDSLRLDLRYVDDWSLKLDTVVLIRTVGAVLRADGAY